MAVIIAQTPAELSMSGNALTYTFTSDKTTELNFAFIVEVYKDTVLHSSHRVYPDNGTFGRFDLSQIAEFELSKPFIPSAFSIDAVNYANFNIEVKEFFGATPVVEGVDVSVEFLCWKAKKNKFESYASEEFTPSLLGGRLLTYFKETSLYVNELFFLYFLKPPSDPYVSIYYDLANGTTVYAHDQGFNYHDCVGVNLSYDTIMNYYAGLASWNDIAKVRVKVQNGYEYYDEYTINLVHDVCCIKPTRLHWLNKIGGMESFSFTRPTRESMSVKSPTYEVSDGQWFGSFYGSNDMEGSTGNFQSESETFLNLESGNVSEATQKIIYNNLMLSPYVLVEYQDRLLRVSRDNVTVKYNRDILDQLFNVEIKINIENFKSMIV